MPKHFGYFELNMSGLQEFDLVATPIHEYYGPSIGSTVLTPVAPPRALGPPPAHCIIDLFSSLGFPDLETGSCRWGSSNCGGFFPPRGVLPHLHLFIELHLHYRTISRCRGFDKGATISISSP